MGICAVFEPYKVGTISQVLWALVRNSQNDWAEHCPMVEFALNNSVSASTGYMPFELNYGYIPQLGQWLNTDTKFVGVRQFMEQALWNVTAAHDAIIAACVMQTHHANRHRQTGDAFAPGDRVYLSTKNLALPKGRAKKLLPKFIGPYKVVEVHTAASTVTLELPPKLTARQEHPMFHMSLLRAHIPNNNVRFPHCDMKACYDFGAADEPEWFVDETLAHRWVDSMGLELQVHWTLGNVMWEPLALCKELAALDEYLELHRVKRPRDLPCKTR